MTEDSSPCVLSSADTVRTAELFSSSNNNNNTTAGSSSGNGGRASSIHENGRLRLLSPFSPERLPTVKGPMEMATDSEGRRDLDSTTSSSTTRHGEENQRATLVSIIDQVLLLLGEEDDENQE